MAEFDDAARDVRLWVPRDARIDHSCEQLIGFRREAEEYAVSRAAEAEVYRVVIQVRVVEAWSVAANTREEAFNCAIAAAGTLHLRLGPYARSLQCSPVYDIDGRSLFDANEV